MLQHVNNSTFGVIKCILINILQLSQFEKKKKDPDFLLLMSLPFSDKSYLQGSFVSCLKITTNFKCHIWRGYQCTMLQFSKEPFPCLASVSRLFLRLGLKLSFLIKLAGPGDLEPSLIMLLQTLLCWTSHDPLKSHLSTTSVCHCVFINNGCRWFSDLFG